VVSTSVSKKSLHEKEHKCTQLADRFRERYFLLGILKNYSIQNFKIYKPQISLKKLQPIFFLHNGLFKIPEKIISQNY